MRFFSMLLSVLLLSGMLSAQKKILVTPTDEVIPIEPGSSASVLMKQWEQRQISAKTGACSDKLYFGYDPVTYPVTSNFGAFHKDVMGQWYEAKADGTIDTIFMQTFGAIGAYDSTVYVRVHESFISDEAGPGVRPGPYNPPCQNWGYWVNTEDADQGVAAFIEDATDTSWVSTINGSPVPSFSPFGVELWGLEGYPLLLSPNNLEYVAMSDLAYDIDVVTGDYFFISMRVANPAANGGHIDESADVRTEWAASGFTVTTGDEDYPSRNWKFYEHDKGPSNCAGFPVDSIKRGWVARGGFTADTLSVGMYNIWYAMTVTSNVPPQISDVTNIPTTFSNASQFVLATITDCNLAAPENAGVATAVLRWSINGDIQTDIPMEDIGSDFWQGEIPGQPAGTNLTYRVIATDLDGAVANGPPGNYSVVAYGSQWYGLDTGVVCGNNDITGTGAVIDTSDFFVPSSGTTSTAPKDDGTAGPFDMGADFTVFGDEFRYAWVGVNGAIALSKTATDTLDVSSNGFYTGGWTFPDGQHNGRTDTAGVANGFMPPMTIAAFWNDLIIGDTANQFGNIRVGDDGDTCLFVVQYDSIGIFDLEDGPSADITKFRIVLNRCTGAVEFQYVSVGTGGLDSTALIGMQADLNEVSGPVAGSIFFNQNGEPGETRPRDNYCVRIYPRIGAGAIEGWNIMAVSMVPNNANYGKTALYPSAVSPAYKYSNGYVTEDPLVMGRGYWLKFDEAGGVGASNASFDHTVTASVVTGWNLFGGPSGIVPVGDITENGMSVTSSYFGYGEAGYFTATDIWPGYGYWVKTDGAGTLDMNSASAAPKAAPVAGLGSGTPEGNRLIIYDAAGRTQTLYLSDESSLQKALSFYEMPPVPPSGAFDARFSSQRFLEAYPSNLTKGTKYEYPISIQAAAYPVAVRWEISSPLSGGRKMVLATADGKSMVIEGSGATMLTADAAKGVVVKLSDDVNLPSTYALSQNYPNPFNPVTHMTVDVAGTSEVDVVVYDMLGRRIAILMKGVQEAGTYNVTWDGRDGNGLSVPTGVYVVRMSADNFSTARKVMLMK